MDLTINSNLVMMDKREKNIIEYYWQINLPCSPLPVWRCPQLCNSRQRHSVKVETYSSRLVLFGLFFSHFDKVDQHERIVKEYQIRLRTPNLNTQNVNYSNIYAIKIATPTNRSRFGDTLTSVILRS